MSPQPKRKPTPAELKEARQKKIAIGGAVILVILLAVLGPHTFKQLHHSQQSTIPPSMRGLAPTATAATQTAPAAALSQLSDTDIVTVQPGSGQLVSFSLFKSKDPFVQQLASATPAATTPSAAPAVPSQPAASKQTVTIPSPATTPAVTAPTPTVVTPVTPAPTPTSPAVTTPAPKPTAPAPTPTPVGSLNSAAISTNGHCEIVPVKGTFPKDDQVFRLVSIAANGASVKIAVAGGSYQSGASAVTLKRGTVLTLVNTADGVRYRLSLLTECPASSGGSSAKTTPTPAPTTTTTTTTTATTTTSATTAPATTVATPTSTTSTTP